MKNLLKSLAAFQSQCPPVKKSAENPYFKSQYASLDAIQHHIKPHLEKNGLLIVQANITQDAQPYVETTLFHTESGERLVSVFPVVVAKHTAQDYGSAVSYAKRYSLSGLLIFSGKKVKLMIKETITTTHNVGNQYSLILSHISMKSFRENKI